MAATLFNAPPAAFPGLKGSSTPKPVTSDCGTSSSLTARSARRLYPSWAVVMLPPLPAADTSLSVPLISLPAVQANRTPTPLEKRLSILSCGV